MYISAEQNSFKQVIRVGGKDIHCYHNQTRHEVIN